MDPLIQLGNIIAIVFVIVSSAVAALRGGKVSHLKELFEQAFNKSSNEVKSAIDELRALNQVALDTMRETLAAKDTLVSQYASRIPQLEAMLDSQRGEIDDLRTKSTLDREDRAQQLAALRAKIAVLEIDLIKAQQERDDEHKKVVALEAEIAVLRDEIAQLRTQNDPA